jgi:hypothetical protein
MPSTKLCGTPRARRLCALALAHLSVAAHGATQLPVGTTVTSYGSYRDGIYIYISPAQPGMEGCIYSAGNQLWIDLTVADGKHFYAMFLSAVLAGKPIGFGVNGCGASGQLPLVYRVDVGQ